jgi:hypothetical protein
MAGTFDMNFDSGLVYFVKENILSVLSIFYEMLKEIFLY